MRAPAMYMPVATAGMPAMRDVSGTWRQFMGMGDDSSIDVYRTLREFGKAPADEAWVFRCILLKAMFAQGVPLRVYVRNGRELLPAVETNDSAAQDLQGLLDDANPVSMNGTDLIAYTVASMSAWGENYWHKVRGRLGGPPQELWWLRAPDIDPKRGRVWIDEYEYRPLNAEPEIYKSRDVVPFRWINLQDPVRGLSPLSAARYEIATSRQISERRTSSIANDSVPPGAWIIPKEADFSTQDESLVRRALRSLRKRENKGKVPILPQDLRWQQIALSPKDAEWIDAGKVSRMTVCAALGVPLVLAGDDDKNSVYRNMVDAERIFGRYMIGELDWLASSINGWLVPDFDPAPPGKRRISVAFDYSEIESLQGPLEDRKRVALMEVERGVRVPNEYRTTFKIGGDVPWGDSPSRLSYVEPLSLIDDQAPGPQPPADDTTRNFHRHSAVRAYYAGTGDLASVAALLGVPSSDQLATGLRRRYTAAQLLDGVPSERFEGLRQKEIA